MNKQREEAKRGGAAKKGGETKPREERGGSRQGDRAGRMPTEAIYHDERYGASARGTRWTCRKSRLEQCNVNMF